MIFEKHPKITQGLIWGIFGIASILLFEIYGNLAQDDAYITFRYARNLAQGKGFVYNDNEWVLGTSTPLYTILLALISNISKFDIVELNKIISVISVWLSAGLLFEIRKSVADRLAFFLVLIYITNPLMRNFIGMESYFLLCFMMLTIWAYQTGKRNVSGICCGLLILIRYEMVLLLIIIGLWDYVKYRKLPFWLLPGIALVSIWLIYATIVFGTPIPLSVSAKLLAPRVSFLFGGTIYWYQVFRENPAVILLIIFSLIGIFGALILKQSFHEYAIIVFFSVVYIVIASFFAGSFPWYYAPLVPGFAVTVIFGINSFSHSPIIDQLKLDKEKKQILENVLQCGIASVLIIIQLSFWFNDYGLFQGKIGDNRYATYKRVSDWVEVNASKEHSMATFEIGYLGYFTDMEIIDLAGLITPGLFPWVDDGAEVSLYHSIQLYSPDFVLVPIGNTTQKEIMDDTENYQMIEFSLDGFLLFEKK